MWFIFMGFLMVGTPPLSAAVHEQPAPQLVVFKNSQVFGLFHFIKALNNEPHTEDQFRELFRKSQFNNAKAQKKLAQYNEFTKYLTSTLAFTDLTKREFDDLQLDDIVATQSILSDNLEDLQSRLQGHFPKAQAKEFFEILHFFEPIYNELLWSKHNSQLKKYIEDLQTQSSLWKIDDIYQRERRFYDSQWEDSEHFVVSFYPVPPELGRHTFGGALPSGLFMGTLMENKHMSSDFGVVIHEVSHALYAQRSQDLMALMKNFFQVRQEPNASLASSYLDEALATAIGNGFAEEKASGKLNEASWYENEIINGYGKAIYPLVKDYLEPQGSKKSKVMDENFLEQALSKFNDTFPKAYLNPQVVFNSINLITDGLSLKTSQAKDLFTAHFQPRFRYASSPIDDSQTFEDLHSNNYPVLVFLSESEITQLQGLLKAMPELVPAKDKLMELKNGQYFCFVSLKGRIYYFLVADNSHDFEIMLKNISESKEITSSIEAQKI